MLRCPITVAKTPVPTEETPETTRIRPRFGPIIGTESNQNQSRINPEPSGASPGGAPGGPPGEPPSGPPSMNLSILGLPPGHPPGDPPRGPLGGPLGSPLGGAPGGSSGGSPGGAPGGFWVDSGFIRGRFWANYGSNSGSYLGRFWCFFCGHRRLGDCDRAPQQTRNRHILVLLM